MIHTVQAGESLGSIARDRDVDVLDVVVSNPHRRWTKDTDGGIAFADPLYVGEDLTVPCCAHCASSGSTCSSQAICGSGQTGDPTPEEEIRAALGAAQLSPGEIQQSVQAYTGLNANAQNAILAIVSGKKLSFSAIAPLVAAGLAATGGVALPVVAAIAAALPILDAIAHIFAGGGDACDPPSWKIGGVCFSQRKRPTGPADTAYWLKWDQFAAPIPPEHRGMTQVTPTGIPSMVDSAFPYYSQTIACELDYFDAHGTPDPTQQFRKAYYLAWQANAEFLINGYRGADPHSLLKATKEAWNASHSNRTPDGKPATYTFQQKGPPSNRSVWCVRDAAPGVSYISMLLNGDIDTQRQDPFEIHTGAPIEKGKSGNAAAASSSGLSTPAKVAVGASVLAAIVALVWAALGKPFTIAAVKKTFASAERKQRAPHPSLRLTARAGPPPAFTGRTWKYTSTKNDYERYRLIKQINRWESIAPWFENRDSELLEALIPIADDAGISHDDLQNEDLSRLQIAAVAEILRTQVARASVAKIREYINYQANLELMEAHENGGDDDDYDPGDVESYRAVLLDDIDQWAEDATLYGDEGKLEKKAMEPIARDAGVWTDGLRDFKIDRDEHLVPWLVEEMREQVLNASAAQIRGYILHRRAVLP